MMMAGDASHGGMMGSSASGALFHRRFVLGSRAEEIEPARTAVLEEIQKHGYRPASCFAIRLALEEALANALKHGNKNDPAKTITLECSVDHQRVVLDVADQGEGFEPDAVPDPTQEENLEIPAGRGIVLMRSFMSQVQFAPPGNRVRLVYDRPPS